MPRTKTAEHITTKPDIFLDSGAPTLYNQYSRTITEHSDGNRRYIGSFFKDRRLDDFSWFETDEFKTYRQAYINLIKERSSLLTVYANLDIINNAELTFENQQFLEGQGLHPMPVWHLGSDEKWLVRYLKAGYKYIALGGMLPDRPSVVIPGLDRIWQSHLTDKDGYPLVKVHGFGVTAVQLMVRYPWHSVDSASWIKRAGYGIVLYPKWRHGRRRFDLFPSSVAVTNRRRPGGIFHLKELSRLERERFVTYIEGLGYRLGRSHIEERSVGFKPAHSREQVWKKLPDRTIIEVVEEPGIINNHQDRMELNALYYIQMVKNLPSWPWPYRPVKARRVGLFDAMQDERPARAQSRDETSEELRIYFAGDGLSWIREAHFFSRLPRYSRLATLVYSRRCNQILDLAQSMRRQRGLTKRKKR